MKKLLSVLLTLYGGTIAYGGNVLVLEGAYQNKNVFVANAMSEDGVGFCAYEVRVNGDVTSDEINSSAFEIDLKQFDLKSGEKVTIQIVHKPGCQPKVLNPGDLQPVPQFEIVSIKLDAEGMLNWEATNEGPELPYIIEQYKWNKWVKAGEVNSNGTEGKHGYKFKLTLTSGSNKVRLIQRNANGQLKMSNSVTTESTEAGVEMNYKNNVISFSRPTAFEVYDAYGQIVKRGYDANVDMSSMDKGDYYINYDNTNQKIRKR